MTAPNDTQREALRRLPKGAVVAMYGSKPVRLDALVHQSWVHHSTRDALLRRGWITIDDRGYVTLTDAGRTAAREMGES